MDDFCNQLVEMACSTDLSVSEPMEMIAVDAMSTQSLAAVLGSGTLSDPGPDPLPDPDPFPTDTIYGLAE